MMFRLLVAIVLAAIHCAAALAQYPAKAIRLVLPFPPGGGVDGAARVIAPALSQALGHPVLIENRPGADGALAADVVIKSPPDGYTLYFGSNTSMLGIPVTRKVPPYDPREAFTPISMAGRITILLAVPGSFPAATLAEFVQYARANPGKISFGAGNVTSLLAASQMMKTSGIRMEIIPYKGDGPTSIDLVAGRLQGGFLAGASLVCHAKEGRVKLLATLTQRRLPGAPEVPTIAEAGMPGISIFGWMALFGPAKMPREVVERLARDMAAVLQRPELRQSLAVQLFEPQASTPDELARFLLSQLELWEGAARDAGVPRE